MSAGPVDLGPALAVARGGGGDPHLLCRDGLDDLFLGGLELVEMIAVAEHAEVAGDAAVGLDRDPGHDLLALLEAEAVQVERVQPDAVRGVRRVLAVVSVDRDDEPAQVLGDLRRVDGHAETRVASLTRRSRPPGSAARRGRPRPSRPAARRRTARGAGGRT